VLAGCDVHRQLQLGEGRPQMRQGVGTDPRLLEQVAGTQQRVRAGLGRERGDPVERAAQVRTQDVTECRACPAEGRVEVQVGEKQ
jgi:hypothetical protein